MDVEAFAEWNLAFNQRKPIVYSVIHFDNFGQRKRISVIQNSPKSILSARSFDRLRIMRFLHVLRPNSIMLSSSLAGCRPASELDSVMEFGFYRSSLVFERCFSSQRKEEKEGKWKRGDVAQKKGKDTAPRFKLITANFRH